MNDGSTLELITDNSTLELVQDEKKSKIDCLSYVVLSIAVLCNDNTKLPLNQTCARIRFWRGKKMY